MVDDSTELDEAAGKKARDKNRPGRRRAGQVGKEVTVLSVACPQPP